jgi:hypothetical protein
LRRYQTKTAPSDDEKVGDSKVDRKTPPAVGSPFPIVAALSIWSIFLMALFTTLTLGWIGKCPVHTADDEDKSA